MMTAVANPNEAPLASVPPAALTGAAILEMLRVANVAFVASVPDICTSASVLVPISEDPRFRLIRVCKEDEGVSICAALSFCDRRAVLLMQQTGLLDSLNALRAIAVDYANPVCMLVGMLGKEPHLAPRASSRYGVRIVTPILEAMGVAYHVLDSDADLAIGARMIDHAYRDSVPLVLLLGREPL